MLRTFSRSFVFISLMFFVVAMTLTTLMSGCELNTSAFSYEQTNRMVEAILGT